jgi:roadblock/LC7 domain-containing protein
MFADLFAEHAPVCSPTSISVNYHGELSPIVSYKNEINFRTFKAVFMRTFGIDNFNVLLKNRFTPVLKLFNDYATIDYLNDYHKQVIRDVHHLCLTVFYNLNMSSENIEAIKSAWNRMLDMIDELFDYLAYMQENLAAVKAAVEAENANTIMATLKAELYTEDTEILVEAFMANIDSMVLNEVLNGVRVKDEEVRAEYLRICMGMLQRGAE